MCANSFPLFIFLNQRNALSLQSIGRMRKRALIAIGATTPKEMSACCIAFRNGHWNLWAFWVLEPAIFFVCTSVSNKMPAHLGFIRGICVSLQICVELRRIEEIAGCGDMVIHRSLKLYAQSQRVISWQRPTSTQMFESAFLI